MLYRYKAFSACALVAILGFAAPSCGGSEGDDETGGGGGSGGKGGSGGAGTDPLHAREVANCEIAPTVKDVEQKIIGPTCAGIGCHRSKDIGFGDYRFVATKSWATDAMEAKSTGKCKDEPIIDKDNPENSLMFRTLQNDPKCENGDEADKMPPSNALKKLTDEQKVCLEEYIKAVTRD